MSVANWDPLREVADLQRSISRLFDSQRPGAPDAPVMAVDVLETADEVIVRADVPGVRRDDVSVQYHSGQLTLRASRGRSLPEGASWLRQERLNGEWTRSFSLGVPVDPEAIDASYADGVLTVRLPKSAEARPKQIAVRTGA